MTLVVYSSFMSEESINYGCLKLQCTLVNKVLICVVVDVGMLKYISSNRNKTKMIDINL